MDSLCNFKYNKDKNENKLSHGPKLRFFKSVNLLEIGLDDNKDLILNLTIRFRRLKNEKKHHIYY